MPVVQGTFVRLCKLLSSTQRLPSIVTKLRYSTHYDTLGLTKDASNQEIREAFVELSKKLHPDKHPGNPLFHKQFVQINEAYSVLSKPSKRKEYDDSLPGPKGFRSQSSRSEEWHPYDETYGQARRNRYDQAMRDRMFAERMFRDHYHDSERKTSFRSNFVMGSVLGSIAISLFVVTLSNRFRENMRHNIEIGRQKNRILLEEMSPYKKKPPDN